jgi:IS30 family transposase
MVLQTGRVGGVAEASRWRRKPPGRGPAAGPEDDYLDGNGRLTSAGRVVIGLRLREKRNYSQIAREIGVHRSTVKREVDAHRVEGHYRSRTAQRQAEQARRRPRPGKIRPGTPLWVELTARLNTRQSPEQIAGRLRHDFPGRDDMQVSHETIYQALYVQGAGALRHELTVERRCAKAEPRVGPGPSCRPDQDGPGSARRPSPPARPRPPTGPCPATGKVT